MRPECSNIEHNRNTAVLAVASPEHHGCARCAQTRQAAHLVSNRGRHVRLPRHQCVRLGTGRWSGLTERCPRPPARVPLRVSTETNLFTRFTRPKIPACRYESSPKCGKWMGSHLQLHSFICLVIERITTLLSHRFATVPSTKSIQVQLIQIGSPCGICANASSHHRYSAARLWPLALRSCSSRSQQPYPHPTFPKDTPLHFASPLANRVEASRLDQDETPVELAMPTCPLSPLPRCARPEDAIALSTSQPMR